MGTEDRHLFAVTNKRAGGAASTLQHKRPGCTGKGDRWEFDRKTQVRDMFFFSLEQFHVPIYCD